MGCPFCKIAPARKASGITAYDYAKNFMTPGSRSRQASVISQPTSVSRRLSSLRASLDASDREPPIYILSGSPALQQHYAPAPPGFREDTVQQLMTPPPKTPRMSGWKHSALSVPAAPSRPPRKSDAVSNRQKRSVSAERVASSNTLAPPEPVLSRCSSSPAIELPEETAERLEAYLKKNQSFSSLHILLNELQAQSNIDSAGLSGYDSDLDDEHWNATCLDLAGIQLPTSRRHSIEKPEKVEASSKNAAEVFITCDPADDDIASGLELLNAPVPTGASKGGLSPNSAANQILTARGVSRLPPMIELRKFSDVSEGDEEAAALPKTPGSWFDQDEEGADRPPSLFLTKSLLSSLPAAEIREEAMVTPPPSENEEDEEDEEPLCPVITHSILHKVLRGLRSEDAAENLISRRGSIGNVSLSGLDDFLKALQVQLTDNEEAESAPTISDLQSALTELLSAEKVNEKQQFMDVAVP
ncbi:Hypothetical predicted protein [Cloeon dipterum]|uniref:Uncharacterized protein n=2 Tax=Cloeon dipterum TaxID=197152 RepID=A0A8S1DL15_9INSE|nr:Hypothetical predicted protein [Cloeon dipterum]